MARPVEIPYSRLRENVVQFFREAKGTRPDVMQVMIDENHYVIKDYNTTSGWFGQLAGPVLVKREIKALTRLQGLTGVPRLYLCDDRKVLVTSYCPSESAAKLTRPLNWLKFEHTLGELITNMHRRGVAHCDLRGPGNILIDAEDRPFLVDYVGCVFAGAAWNKPWNIIFRQACQADLSAILKLKKKLAPEQLTVRESKRVEQDALRGGRFRRISRRLRRFARWIFATGKN